jgi:hypothetical protein
MYETDTDGASIELEEVGHEEYRGHLITWRTGKYLGFRDQEDRTSFRITNPEGASTRVTLVKSAEHDIGLTYAKNAIDRNIDAPARRVKPSDVERDIISRWVMEQSS